MCSGFNSITQQKLLSSYQISLSNWITFFKGEGLPSNLINITQCKKKNAKLWRIAGHGSNEAS